MAWSIVWTDQATRDLSRLDPPVARRVVRKLEQVAANPLRSFRRLVGADDYKLRVGDDRLLAVVDLRNRRVIVERIGHPSKVYEKPR
jgi:mRNA interferase RelE/StbE